ncbi:MAG TPA: cobalamin biosynthesis protein [Methylibium sp.]|nr:cobalamin biosynthesis protein [Methylibium sp.]
MRVAGFGLRRDATLDSLRDALARALAAAPPAAGPADALAWLAAAQDKADAACLRALADELGLPLCAVAPAQLASIPTLTDSPAVRALRGSGSPAEAAALAVARRHGGPGAALLQPRAVSADRLATCALAGLAPPSRTCP